MFTIIMDTKNKMIKTHTNKNGEEVTYCYDTRRYYENYKDKRGYAVCDVCASVVLDQYLAKHKTSKKCSQFASYISKIKVNN